MDEKSRYYQPREPMMQGSCDESEAVRSILHGDTESFRRIVESYTPPFHGLAKRMLPDRSPENIEDALQEIFLLMFKALPRYDQERPFFTWAYTIALNYLRSRIRKGKRTAKHLASVPYDEDIGVLQGNGHQYQPEDALIASEADRILDQAIRSLKPKYREVFILRQLQDMSVTDTARTLHIPEGTVKTQLFRARQQLRRFLSDRTWISGDWES